MTSLAPQQTHDQEDELAPQPDLEQASDAAARRIGEVARPTGQAIEPAAADGYGFGDALTAGVYRGPDDGPVDVGAVVGGTSGAGEALPAELRGKFEASLGADLSGVRVHTGDTSASAASSLGARAYAAGSDIHFGAGQYDTASRGGQELIAHEVAHTVQHAGAGGPRMKSALSSPHDAVEADADRAAAAMIDGRRTAVTATSSTVDRWVDRARAAWAISFIGGAPQDVATRILQQLRTARGTQAPAASGVPVRLTLGDPAHPYSSRSGTVLREDLEDLMELARGRARPANPYASVPAQHSEYPNASGVPQAATVDQEPRSLQPGRRTGVEGTPVQARLDALVSQVRADLQRWREYRGSMSGPPPRLASAATAGRSEERRYGTSADRVQYLQRAIGTNNVESLREMTSVLYSHDAQMLAEMFGVTANPYVRTTYRIRIDGDDATITYDNAFGMHYSHDLRLHTRSQGTQERGVGSNVMTGEDHTPVFYSPDRFVEPYLIMNAQLGTSDQHLGSIRFRHGQQFMLYAASGHSLRAGMSVGVGTATDQGNHQANARPPRPGRRPAPDPGGQTLIYRTDIYFNTGSEEVTTGGNNALDATLRHIDEYRIRHPDAPIQIHVTGSASPRWSGATASEADRLNLNLADRRVHRVRDQLANAQASHTGGGHCDFHTQTCPPTGEILIDSETHPTNEGSATARDAGVTRREDPAEWRRVEVLVYGREYHANPVQPEPQASLPASP